MKKRAFLSHSIFIKYPLIMLLTITILGTSSVFLTRYLTNLQLKKTVEEESSLIITTLNWAIAPLLARGEIASIQRLLENTGSYDIVSSIRIYDTKNRVIASSRIEEIGKTKIEKIVNEVLKEKKFKAIFSDFKNNKYNVCVPIKGIRYDSIRKSDINALLFLDINLHYKNKVYQAVRLSLIYQDVFLFLVLTLVFILFTYKIILIPLREFKKATQKISNGNYQFRIKLKNKDEIGEFAKLFNEMLCDINKKNKMIEAYSQQLEEKVAERTKSLKEAKDKLENAYERLKSTQNELLQAKKMEAIGRLAGGVAHDFNNMLTVIIGYSTLMLKNLDKEDSLYSFAKEIKKAGDHSAGLTNQLLAFSRKQLLRKEILNLNKLYARIEKMLHRLIGEDIDLATILEPDLGLVEVDPVQLEQVIINLAVNARDAMPKGGKIIIGTANVFIDGEYVLNNDSFQPGHYVLFSISDTGIGMNEETKSHIFDPFFSTKEMNKGTGLGLSMVYGIIKQSGGEILVDSEPGEGTTFKIYLPQVDKNAKHDDQKIISDIPIHGKETILLVEDEDIVRKYAHRVLVHYGYNILVASNPGEALLICKQYEGAIHLMVTDVVMPEMSGYELAEQLITLFPNMDVLYISGYTENTHLMMLDSKSAFLQKPFTPYSLACKIREMLDKSQSRNI